MRRKEFDVVGVRKDGFVCGYVEAVHLGEGAIGECIRSFEEATCLAEDEPVSQVLRILQESPRVFVVRTGLVSSIITRGDLEKMPLRMWLFALVSLLEMQMLRLIREFYPAEKWRPFLTENRMCKAEETYAKRRAGNDHIDLADCLQFCDKRDIILQTAALLKAMEIGDDPHSATFFKELEDLRNDLAHAQSIVSDRWPHLVELSAQAERILTSCEGLYVGSRSATQHSLAGDAPQAGRP